MAIKGPISFFNTLTRKVVPLRPIKKTAVGLYTCGPTVYNYAHLGNLRTYVFEDLLERTFLYLGYRVNRVMNVTDVGHLTGDGDDGVDKLEREAKSEAKSVKEIARFYTKAFLEDMKKLNVRIPKIIAPASKYVPDQVKIIKILFEKGFAYDTSEAVYFDTSRLKDYGKLSGQKLAEKTVGARAEVVTKTSKRHPTDFVLWFKLMGKFEHHLLRWDSPWGVGFPGWHIECSAISRKFLGQPFDIHTGGVDHIGTHHTNEIAQSEAAFGKPLANIWLHGEFLLIETAKMAKSESNFITVKDLERQRVPAAAFRYLVLTAHYRSPLHFSWSALDQARQALTALIGRALYAEFMSHAKDLSRSTKLTASRPPKGGDPAIVVLREKFRAALANDLNVPQALAVVHELVGNKALATRDPKGVLGALYDFDEVLGLRLKTYVRHYRMSELMKDKRLRTILAEREEFRRLQQFIQSDSLRKKLAGLGYITEDTPIGPYAAPKLISL